MRQHPVGKADRLDVGDNGSTEATLISGSGSLASATASILKLHLNSSDILLLPCAMKIMQLWVCRTHHFTLQKFWTTMLVVHVSGGLEAEKKGSVTA